MVQAASANAGSGGVIWGIIVSAVLFVILSGIVVTGIVLWRRRRKG